MMKTRRWIGAVCAGAGLLAGAGHASAQTTEDATRVAGEELSAEARAQLEEAREAAAAFGTPEAARAAGYVPVFGHVPLQGEHYVRMDLVRSGRFDVRRPPVLMFASLDGTEALVGAAYAYLHPTDAPMPEGFEGDADAWHTHDDLTDVPGKHLVMTHVWLVDAPGGPFARYNPWLPFLAAGLAPPPAATDDARELALALTLALEMPREAALVERHAGPELAARAEPHREAIRALVPPLRGAREAGDAAEYARLSAEVAAHSSALLAAYREAAAASPRARRVLDRLLAAFLPGAEGEDHGAHGH